MEICLSTPRLGITDTEALPTTPSQARTFSSKDYLMCHFLYLKDPLNFWMRFLLFLLRCFCYCHGDPFRCLLMHGCCGDHQPPLSAFQGSNTFPSDQPALVLVLALGVHVPLLQGALWWVVALGDAT